LKKIKNKYFKKLKIKTVMPERKNNLIRLSFRPSDYDSPGRVEYEINLSKSNEKDLIIQKTLKQITLDDTSSHMLRDMLNYADTYLPVPEMYSLLEGSFTHCALARTVSKKYLDDAMNHMEALNPEMTLKMLRAKFYDFPSSTTVSQLKYLFACIKELQKIIYKKHELSDDSEFYRG